jgi:hypothetical protein
MPPSPGVSGRLVARLEDDQRGLSRPPAHRARLLVRQSRSVGPGCLPYGFTTVAPSLISARRDAALRARTISRALSGNDRAGPRSDLGDLQQGSEFCDEAGHAKLASGAAG